MRLAAYGLGACSKALQTAGRALPCWDLLPRGNRPALLEVISWLYEVAGRGIRCAGLGMGSGGAGDAGSHGSGLHGQTVPLLQPQLLLLSGSCRSSLLASLQ